MDIRFSDVQHHQAELLSEADSLRWERRTMGHSGPVGRARTALGRRLVAIGEGLQGHGATRATAGGR